MKNSVLKGVLGALAVAGVAMVAKKVIERKRFVRGIFNEYGIKEKSPFGLADKIREMDEEKYQELKEKFKKEFSSRCCRTDAKKEVFAEA
ncbi:hypothetical protein [Chryseobacterium chendengshani]|uniref:hypothetical protein n=1 Tax=unclassified Chryseobacterium TaxID=2593645 RepID=UPI001C64402A|nr:MULTISPECIES: hypothetical protein [unclassified Chryseobacterium]MBW7674814.1 hypothetical protein [Chryseobacterium sp. LJ756]MBW8523642.1 hypothetical protein [Chryseobacterium sp. LJ668]QYK15924.1 hypothetical protein K0U91_12760 [Chryseobacterium sp. LJ668]